MEVDARGLKCPIPIVKLMKAIASVAEGDEVTIHANDRAFKADLHAWCKRTGHLLVSFDEKDSRDLVAVVRKAK